MQGPCSSSVSVALTDETYSLLCDAEVPEGADPNQYRFLIPAMLLITLVLTILRRREEGMV